MKRLICEANIRKIIQDKDVFDSLSNMSVRILAEKITSFIDSEFGLEKD